MRDLTRLAAEVSFPTPTEREINTVTRSHDQTADWDLKRELRNATPSSDKWTTGFAQ